MQITERDKAIWRAAITLANNICVRESDRENERDGDTGWIHGTAECARAIRAFVEPEEAVLKEMFTEAEVPGYELGALAAPPKPGSFASPRQARGSDEPNPQPKTTNSLQSGTRF